MRYFIRLQGTCWFCRSLQYNKVAAYIAGYSKKNIKAPKVIHCVGHSLGGALASLATDLVSKIVSSILSLLRISGLVHITQQKMRSYLGLELLAILESIFHT
ncbi:lipase family protein [Vibrio parahaemolyticus]|uniref:lipase family protein n=1 Tax=Vibrio parahaemolyticus TaxID=670 RepID=UPI0038D4FE13